jgi:hypothetical protein
LRFSTTSNVSTSDKAFTNPEAAQSQPSQAGILRLSKFRWRRLIFSASPSGARTHPLLPRQKDWRYIRDPRINLLSVSGISKRLRQHALPFIYRDVQVSRYLSSSQMKLLLPTLLSQPGLLGHIRTVCLDIDNSDWDRHRQLRLGHRLPLVRKPTVYSTRHRPSHLVYAQDREGAECLHLVF